MADHRLLANVLDGAARLGLSLSALARRHGLTLAVAYQVQDDVVGRRLAHGARLVGAQMGFTSEAMRRQMGVEAPNIGWLTSDMALPDGRLAAAGFIHPRLEPEVAILLGPDVDGAAGPEAVAACVKAYAPANELVDCRFHDYKFYWLDNVADNSSSAAFVLRPWRAPESDVGGLKARLLIDGEAVDEGESAAAMGHPLIALAERGRAHRRRPGQKSSPPV